MPRRVRDLERLVRRYDVTLETPSSGSHYRWRHPDGRSLSVPAHNGRKTEVADHYVKQLALFVGCDYRWLLTAKK